LTGRFSGRLVSGIEDYRALTNRDNCRWHALTGAVVDVSVLLPEQAIHHL